MGAITTSAFSVQHGSQAYPGKTFPIEVPYRFDLGIHAEQLVRYRRERGDAEKAKSVYEGTRPLSAADVADAILYAVTRPLHMVVDEVVLMSIDQSNGFRVHRG